MLCLGRRIKAGDKVLAMYSHDKNYRGKNIFEKDSDSCLLCEVVTDTRAGDGSKTYLLWSFEYNDKFIAEPNRIVKISDDNIKRYLELKGEKLEDKNE